MSDFTDDEMESLLAEEEKVEKKYNSISLCNACNTASTFFK